MINMCTALPTERSTALQTAHWRPALLTSRRSSVGRGWDTWLSSRHSSTFAPSYCVTVATARLAATAATAATARRAKKAKQKPQKPKPLKPQAKRGSTAAVPVYPPEEIFSLDVECVAVGKSHEKSDRMPCSYALVDGKGDCVKRTLIQPSREVVSYLTPFTGLHPGDLDGQRALSLDRARRELQELLPRRAILVGQEPQGDIEWMSLNEGQDFTGTVNLSEIFSNEKGMVFSLRHEARVLLGREPDSSVHDPCWDAKVSIDLYKLASSASPKELAALREKLTKKEFWPPKPSLARECGYQLDGVCLSMCSGKSDLGPAIGHPNPFQNGCIMMYPCAGNQFAKL